MTGPVLTDLADSLREPDGLSILPVLLGKKARDHASLYWEYHSQGGAQAVRMGRWKAVRKQAEGAPNGPIELYDLRADPGEKTDVSARHRDVVRRIVEIMRTSHAPAPLPEWDFVASR